MAMQTRSTAKAASSCPCCAVKCQLCGEQFEDKGKLEEKLFSTFEIEADLKSFSEADVKTPCKKKELAKRTCPHCSASFRSPKGLNQHIGKVHDSSSKESLCPFCSKRFKTKYAVKFHVNQVHEQKTRVKCPICERSLYNKYALKEHLREEHEAR